MCEKVLGISVKAIKFLENNTGMKIKSLTPVVSVEELDLSLKSFQNDILFSCCKESMDYKRGFDFACNRIRKRFEINEKLKAVRLRAKNSNTKKYDKNITKEAKKKND